MKTISTKQAAQRGFSMVELLIVIAVIVIIAAIALPNLTKSKAAANEQLAKARAANVASTQATFRSVMRKNRYATLQELRNTTAGGVPLLSPADVDPSGVGISHGGWRLLEVESPTATTFAIAIEQDGAAPDFSVSQAQPPREDGDGGWVGGGGECFVSYCVHEDAVVRRSECGPCTRSSPPAE